MQTEVDSNYGTWRLNVGVVIFVVIFLVFLPGICLFVASLGVIAYGCLKVADSPHAAKLLPGPFVLVDIVVEDAKIGLRQARQERRRARLLARYGPGVERL